jgi:hypothetical protein
MKEPKTLTSNNFQPAEVPVVGLEVPVVGLEVPVVGQFCPEKIDSDKFVSDHYLFPLKGAFGALLRCS